jgi:chromosome partitioning protein
MQVVSFMNMKGGVGKTTLAVNVAYCLARVHKKKVLVVDGDPQFNATQYLLDSTVYLKHVQNDKKGTLRDIFVPKRPGPISTVVGKSKKVNKARMALSACTCPVFDGGQDHGKLDLIPSSLQLMDIDTSKRGTEVKLAAYLKERAVGYDYVIIDCPPTISIFTQAAVLASSRYVVPVKPDLLSVLGLPLLETWLDEYTDDHGITVEQVGLVFTLVRGNTPRAMRDVMEDLREERKDKVFTAHLSESTDVAKSVDYHMPVFLYKPRAKTADEILAITQEFVTRTTS